MYADYALRAGKRSLLLHIYATGLGIFPVLMSRGENVLNEHRPGVSAPIEASCALPSTLPFHAGVDDRIPKIMSRAPGQDAKDKVATHNCRVYV